MDTDKTIIKPRPGKAAATDDKTVIKPRPAGQNMDADKTVITPRRKNPKAQALSPATNFSNKPVGNATGHQTAHHIQPMSIAELPGLPALIQDAAPLLSILSQLKQLNGSAEIINLHRHTSGLITQFCNAARKHSDQDVIKKCSYALCAAIDEAVLNTSWGENSSWSQKPMLSVFHQETYGGEKFYKILDHEVTDDVKNFDLIELLYMCLSLGFMGKMRIDEHGSTKVEKIRANTYQLLVKNRNRFKRGLSTGIKPIITDKNKLYSFLPIWILMGTLILGAFALYQHWLLELNKKSDIVITELAKLIPTPTDESLPDNKIRKEVLLLRQLLEQEIERDVLSVDDYHNRSAVVLHANELFPSGSADINTAFYPIMDKIAKAMESIQGRILVSGHTDNIAIRTARYPSNWHLSLARASAVGKYMSSSADLKTRLLPEGRGDSEPVDSNDSVEGRAKNRRVVIELFYNDQ